MKYRFIDNLFWKWLKIVVFNVSSLMCIFDIISCRRMTISLLMNMSWWTIITGIRNPHSATIIRVCHISSSISIIRRSKRHLVRVSHNCTNYSTTGRSRQTCCCCWNYSLIGALISSITIALITLLSRVRARV